VAIHIFDIDGTLVNYHTSEWLDGALDMLINLQLEGHQIMLITMRGSQDNGTIWSTENTEKTLLADLDKLGIKYLIIFGVQTPRILHDDSEIILDKRETNQTWKPL
jgi:hypothetical protein